MPPRQWSDELADAGVSAADWVANRLAERRLYVGIGDETVEALRTHFPEHVRSTLEAASKVLAHEFNLLGSGRFVPRDPDRPADADGYEPIDWYLDPISQLRFPRGIAIADWTLDRMRPGLADIKLPWELARCQHWPLLGQAYRLTRDDRFAREIARELQDFTEANPIGTAVNWACTMDVALRAANWALAFELVHDCASLTASFWSGAYRALFDHGTFIEGHLENNYEVTSNHFLSNVVGLFFVAAVFGDLPCGRIWNTRCREWLAHELDVQVLPDGADYESSVPYHRLVAELFLGAARLADSRGRPFPNLFLDRLRSMIDFLVSVMRPDGLMPQVGDADDGRLHILTQYGTWNPQDARHLLGPAACMFDHPGWMTRAGAAGRCESIWWGLEPARLSSAGSVASPPLRHFPRAGVTVMRRDTDYLLITNGVVGTAGFGNHKHNDLLGFEYHVRGTPVLVDAGSYVYTSDPAARNSFRSTMSHNTVSIDGEEQNEFKPDWLFRMFEKAVPEHVSVVESADAIEYRGRHNGYARLPDPVVHDRTFTLSPVTGLLTIVDRFEGRGPHRLRWHFHFAPGVEVVSAGGGRFDVCAGQSRITMIADAALQPTIVPAWYSSSYGVRIHCTALEFDVATSIDGRREYRFQITP
jgi:uncharacterized heparinase superfamily protein